MLIMYCHKNISYIICLLSLLFNISNVFAISTSEQPPSVTAVCKDQPQCDFIAKEKKWPKEEEGGGSVTFSNLAFDIKFPKEFNKVAVVWGELPLYVVLYNDKKITVGMEEVPGEETSSDFPLLLEDKTHSSWLPIDIFEIIFKKTSSNKEPSNSYERYLWRTAFFHKVITYGPTTSAIAYEKGLWKAYMANVGDPTNNRLTIITHKKYPNRYLTIRDNGVEQKFIEKLIATIELN
jgi:hypothetical protein